MRWLIVAVLFLSNNVFSQHESWDYADYENITNENFRTEDIFNQKIDTENVDYPLLHAAIFYVTNEVRTKKGLEPFSFNVNLEIAAWHHSKAMAEKGFFNHNNIHERKRRTPNERAVFAGITNPFLAENIAETSALQYTSGDPIYIIDKNKGVFSYEDGGDPIESETYLGVAEIVVDQWMNSRPHRKNILSPDGLQLGCGAYLFLDNRFYNMPTFKITQNFQWYEPVNDTIPADPLPK
jgi:uncharacterized protein YkwD